MGVADGGPPWPLDSSEHVYDGVIVSVRLDVVRDPSGEAVTREIVAHPGAVAVVAVDADGRVMVIRQYRQAAGLRMVELPAGLLDVDGEAPLAAAQRELREEAGLVADAWSPLLDILPSPGVSDERVTVYLAEDVRSAGQPDGYVARHEEADLVAAWVPLADLVSAVLSGRVRNGIVVAGSLALWARTAEGREVSRLGRME